MKKGFTLMELLAVIVILAIISLIASPIVIGLIEDSNKQAAERSTEAVVSAAKTLYTMHQMDATTYLLETDATKLDVDNPPTDGDVNYDTSGAQVVITIPSTSKVVFGQYQCTYLAGKAACAKS